MKGTRRKAKDSIIPTLRRSSIYTDILKHVIPAGIAAIHDCMDAGGRATQEQLLRCHGWQLQNSLAVFSYMNPILIYFFTSLCSRQLLHALLSIAVPDAILPPPSMESYHLHNPHGCRECRYCRSKYLSMQSWIPAIPAAMTVYLRNLCITMTVPASH